jgi:GNAT superfamily N-acetyltransferase
MRIKLEIATADDAADLASLRNATSDHLTSQFGKGPWSGQSTEKGARFGMTRSTVYIARNRGRLIASFALSTRKPWSIDKTYFTACERPLYLTSMAIIPGQQRKGIGRLCLEGARRIAKKWPSDAIRLDAFDATAGAGEFYRKCGFREVGRTSYRNSPLIYFEMLL